MRKVEHSTACGELKPPKETGIQQIFQEEKKWLTVEMALASACFLQSF